MDRIREKVAEFARKYRYVLLVLFAGIALMLIPGAEGDKQETPVAEATRENTPDVQKQLQEILSKIQGAGRVEVMLTVANGEKVIYQCDDDYSGGENETSRRETVIVTDADRAQTGLVQQVVPPVFQGVIVVCQGADSATVRLSIVDAVSKVTGVGADRISVLKMK